MKPVRLPPAPPCPGGFTLVEMLVSMTVLVLMLALVAQLTNSASQTITSSGKRTDSDSQSRLVFSRLGQDLARLVKRRDVDFSTFKQPANSDPAINQPANLQAGNDRFAFYSETLGGYTPPGGSTSGDFSAISRRASLSLIAYQVAVERRSGFTTLGRLGKALGWEPESTGKWANPVYLPLKLTDLRVKDKNGTVNPIQLFSATPTDPASPVDPDYSTIGDMVFRFEYSYLLKANPNNAGSPNAHLSIVPYDPNGKPIPAKTTVDGFRDVAAIVVTLGILDSTSRVITSQNPDQIAKLIGVFPDAVDGQDTLKAWQAVLLRPTFATDAGLPRSAASAVRLYQRTFSLEPAN